MSSAARTWKRPVPAPAGVDTRFVLSSISWQDYEKIGEILRDRPGLRLTYDRGTLELMTTSHAHEKYKMRLGRMLETLAEESGLAIAPAGNTTFKREAIERGLEPDQCYWIEHEEEMRRRGEWDPERDPPPDLAIEIELSPPAADRMAIYAALGVPEVWRFDGLTIEVHVLGRAGKYRRKERSPTFAWLAMQSLLSFLNLEDPRDYLTLIAEFRSWVRTQLAKK